MKRDILKVFGSMALIVIALALCYFFLSPRQYSAEVWSDDKFIYAEGLGKVPLDKIGSKQGKLVAIKAAKDNARWRLLKAVFNEDSLFSENVVITSYRENSNGIHIEGFVRFAELIALKNLDARTWRVTIKVPIETS